MESERREGDRGGGRKDRERRDNERLKADGREV